MPPKSVVYLRRLVVLALLAAAAPTAVSVMSCGSDDTTADTSSSLPTQVSSDI